MRAFLMLFAACGGAAVQPPPPDRTSMQPQKPSGEGAKPLVVAAADPVPPTPPPSHPLVAAGKVFAIDPDLQPVACREWSVDASRLRRPGLEIAFGLEAGTISFSSATATDPAIDPDADPSGDAPSLSSSCDIALPLREEADAFAVGEARWFKTRAACDKAVAARARVALDLRECAIGPLAPPAERSAARDRFEAILKGGRLFELTPKNTCAAVAFTPAQARYGDYLEGSIAAPPLKLRYLMRKGGVTLTLISPKAKPHRDLECSQINDIMGGKDTVHVGRLLYFTDGGCRARIAANVERAKWLAPLPPPPPPPPPEEATPGGWLEIAQDTCGVDDG